MNPLLCEQKIHVGAAVYGKGVECVVNKYEHFEAFETKWMYFSIQCPRLSCWLRDVDEDEFGAMVD